MIAFRHCDSRYPFLWEEASQPSGRWHEAGEGPAHYLADTPVGAWAEFVRHEEIVDADDLRTVTRALWAVEFDDEAFASPNLPDETLLGGTGSYGACQDEARRLRAEGHSGLIAPSAALLPDGATGSRVDGGLQPGPARDGKVFVLFGARPRIVGWAATVAGRPDPELLARVRYL